MNDSYQALHSAHNAIKATRLLGYDCRNMITSQLADSDIVVVTQGKTSVAWNGRYFHYHGRPSRALAQFTNEFSQLAK